LHKGEVKLGEEEGRQKERSIAEEYLVLSSE